MPLERLRTIVPLLALCLLGVGNPTAVQAQVTPKSTMPPALELVVLGSGGPGAVGRAASSHLVLLDGKARILVDAGPGAFARVGEGKLSLAEADIVLLTHLHADHTSELPGLFKARAVSAGRPISFRVFGPGGHRPYPSTEHFIDLLFGKRGAFAYLPDFAAPITLKATDVVAGAGIVKTLVDADGLKISARAGHHGDAPAVIYRIDYKGRSLVFSGDIDAAGLPALTQMAHQADLLVFNSVVLDPPGSPQQLYALHSPPRVIGEVAAHAQVSRVLLAHISPAVERAQEEVLASIRNGYSGPVSLATDLQHIEFSSAGQP